MNKEILTNSSGNSSNHSPADHTQPQEGPVAKAIEKQTSKIPSDTFLWLAVASIGASAVLQYLGKSDRSNFIGQWAPTLLILGVYNKLVKVAGSDRSDKLGAQVLVH